MSSSCLQAYARHCQYGYRCCCRERALRLDECLAVLCVLLCCVCCCAVCCCIEKDKIITLKLYSWARRPGAEGKFTCSTAHELASSLGMSALVLPPQPNGIAGVSMLCWKLELGSRGGKSKQEGTALCAKTIFHPRFTTKGWRNSSQQWNSLSRF